MLLGANETYTGSPLSARAHLEAALPLWISANRTDGQAETLKQLSWLSGIADDRTRALGEIAEALVLVRKLDFPARELDLHLHKANLALQWDDLERAKLALKDAEALIEFAAPLHKAQILDQRGILAFKAGKYDTALNCYLEAADIYRYIRAAREEFAVRRGIAATLNRMGRLSEARDVVAGTLMAAQAMGNVSGEAEARATLAKIEHNAGRLTSALEELQSAARLYREAGHLRSASSLDAEAAALRTQIAGE